MKTKIIVSSSAAILALALTNTSIFAQTNNQQNTQAPNNTMTIKYIPNIPGQPSISDSETQYINSLSSERGKLIKDLIQSNTSGTTQQFSNSSEGSELKTAFKNDPSFAKSVVSHADSSNPDYLKNNQNILNQPLSLGQTVKYVFPDGSAVIRSSTATPINQPSSPLSGQLLNKVSAATDTGVLTNLGSGKYEFRNEYEDTIYLEWIDNYLYTDTIGTVISGGHCNVNIYDYRGASSSFGTVWSTYNGDAKVISNGTPNAYANATYNDGVGVKGIAAGWTVVLTNNYNGNNTNGTYSAVANCQVIG